MGKSPTGSAVLIAGLGVECDAHIGGERQVSLLAQESINKGIASGVELSPGDFGENLTIEGMDLLSNGTGWRFFAGNEAILQISGIGKVCHHPCSIGQRLGDCIMPREGVFAKVIRGGTVYPGDSVEVTAMKVGAVMTSSDRCASGERRDESGRLLVDLLQELGIAVVNYSILPDEETELSAKMKFLADRQALDIILTTGGTGLSPRDHTPEATQSILDAPSPGISEAIRQEGMKHTLFACLSRGVSGLRGRTLIINLPGSRRAIEESSPLLRSIIPHALEILRAEISDCGIVHERP